jgi:hypothetical protein
MLHEETFLEAEAVTLKPLSKVKLKSYSELIPRRKKMDKMVKNQPHDKQLPRLLLIQQTIEFEQRAKEATKRFKLKLDNKKAEGIKHE